ncbi:Hypothetical predicted protein [Octopus vulgaris]|uniref:Uncharacterized protein n=1 Tax=Octopus vulgaris TaxID=6645 RepID=A0AA36BIP3_OCTVU|nr:Hypothetical predicted protein [Octopus vulgaris]
MLRALKPYFHFGTIFHSVYLPACLRLPYTIKNQGHCPSFHDKTVKRNTLITKDNPAMTTILYKLCLKQKKKMCDGLSCILLQGENVYDDNTFSLSVCLFFTQVLEEL